MSNDRTLMQSIPAMQKEMVTRGEAIKREQYANREQRKMLDGDKRRADDCEGLEKRLPFDQSRGSCERREREGSPSNERDTDKRGQEDMSKRPCGITLAEGRLFGRQSGERRPMTSTNWVSQDTLEQTSPPSDSWYRLGSRKVIGRRPQHQTNRFLDPLQGYQRVLGYGLFYVSPSHGGIV